MSQHSLLKELQQRKVVQTAAVYVAVAWGVTEIVVTIVDQLFLPRWVSTLAVIFFVVGFPISMFLSWTFDLTPDGIQRTVVESRRGKASIVLSMVLLLAGTAGLFLLIRPNLDSQVPVDQLIDIPPNSIAVLPFENAGEDEADAYRSSGLSDGLRDQLGGVTGLRIAARSSSVAAQDRGMDASTASGTLGVAYLVEGSLRRQGSRFRVSVQLIEGRTGLAVWSSTFERSGREFVNVQQTIADEVVKRVLPDAEEVVTSPATQDPDANELMQLGQFYEQQFKSREEVDEESVLKAIDYYRDATEADPRSAIAHSRLAGALLFLDVDSAEAPMFKALALDPNLSEVQTTLGEFYWARNLLTESDTAYRRALQLNPNNVEALQNYGHLVAVSSMTIKEGESDRADLFRRARDLDRLSLSGHFELGTHLGNFGYTDELRQVIKDIQALFDTVDSDRAVAWLYEMLGEVDLAIAWTIRARDREPDNPDHVDKLADLYAMIGDGVTAEKLAPEPFIGLLFQMRRHAELIDIAEFAMIEDPGDMEIRYLLGFAYAAEGQYEAAIRILTSAGLPDNVLEGRTRSMKEVEAYFTLVDTLAGSDIPEGVELGRALAARLESGKPWQGDIGWVAMYRSCVLTVQGRREEALELLPRIKESPRLRRQAILRDSWCMRQYAEEPAYLDVLQDQDERQARLREKLPATLAEFGVSL